MNPSSDIKLAALKTIKFVAKTEETALDFDRVRMLVPEFVSLLRDRNTAFRSAAELALGFMLQLHRNDQLFDVSIRVCNMCALFPYLSRLCRNSVG